MYQIISLLTLAILLIPTQISTLALTKNQNKWNLCQQKTSIMAQISNSFAKVGANVSQIKTAQKVACFESNMSCQIVSKANKNRSRDFGLFQINSVHRQKNMTNCQSNINYAIKLSNNGKNWKLWSALKLAKTVK